VGVIKISTHPLLIGKKLSLPPLPQSIRTYSGETLDLRDDQWRYGDATFVVSINFLRLPAVAPDFLHSIKLVLVWYAQNLAGRTLVNYFHKIQHFLKTLGSDRSDGLTSINSIDLINYRSAISAKNWWYLGHLSMILRKWSSLGYSGVSEDAVKLLLGWRIKGAPKGEAVLTMDPMHGPYTDIELQAIHAAVRKAYLSKTLPISDYLLILIFMLLGQRVAQIAALKVCDVSVVDREDGGRAYFLRVPRVKQRAKHPRVSFTCRVLIEDFGELLISYAAKIREQHAGLLADPMQLALFPTQGRKIMSNGYQNHRTSDSLHGVLKNSLNKLCVYSERTGRPINVTPTRFRRTLGTRAAAEGHGELVIAELLDHSDTQNVGVYVAATSAIVERIDRAVAFRMAPLAQAFAGVIITDESGATRHNDPSSRILDPRIDQTLSPMGSCGKHGFCGYLAPIACYTCGNFQPWLDGPHEAVLSHLMSERDRLILEADLRVASVNDRTILAVAEVIQRCAAIRVQASKER
jgi:integrase